jgi:hypothetical protein
MGFQRVPRIEVEALCGLERFGGRWILKWKLDARDLYFDGAERRPVERRVFDDVRE